MFENTAIPPDTVPTIGVTSLSPNPSPSRSMSKRRLEPKGLPPTPLKSKDIEVKAIGRRKGEVEGVLIETTLVKFNNIDTVTLYVSAKNQTEYYQYIIDLKPKRVLFNPGTENASLEQLLRNANIYVERACTLVLLGLNTY